MEDGAGWRLREAIKFWGHSISALCDELERRGIRGSSRPTAHRYLAGSRTPSVQWLRAVADITGVRFEWLGEGRGSMSEAEEGWRLAYEGLPLEATQWDRVMTRIRLFRDLENTTNFTHSMFAEWAYSFIPEDRERPDDETLFLLFRGLAELLEAPIRILNPELGSVIWADKVPHLTALLIALTSIPEPRHPRATFEALVQLGRKATAEVEVSHGKA